MPRKPLAPHANDSPQEADDWRARDSGLAVLVSGGAPTLHLIAGALCAFYEERVSFDLIGASGAGALPGLLYAAPKAMDANGERDPVTALRNTVNLNVADLVYHAVSANFKVFPKYGPLTGAVWKTGRRLPRFDLGSPEPHYQPSLKRLYNDCLDLLLTAATPTTLNYYSKGMCTRVPELLDEIVDWEYLRTRYPKEYLLNAFDLDEQKLTLFAKSELTAEHFFAALAMPWLFAPQRVETADGTATFTEGASHDPSGLAAVWSRGEFRRRGVRRIIALQTVTPDLWYDPANIYDALQVTIMDPLVTLSEQTLGLYAMMEQQNNDRVDGSMPKLYVLPFDIPAWEAGRLLEWSYSNGLTLWHLGYEAAKTFCSALQRAEGTAAVADDGVPDLETYRYYQRCKDIPRTKAFLELFDDLL